MPCRWTQGTMLAQLHSCAVTTTALNLKVHAGVRHSPTHGHGDLTCCCSSCSVRSALASDTSLHSSGSCDVPIREHKRCRAVSSCAISFEDACAASYASACFARRSCKTCSGCKHDALLLTGVVLGPSCAPSAASACCNRCRSASPAACSALRTLRDSAWHRGKAARSSSERTPVFCTMCRHTTPTFEAGSSSGAPPCLLEHCKKPACVCDTPLPAAADRSLHGQ